MAVTSVMPLLGEKSRVLPAAVLAAMVALASTACSKVAKPGAAQALPQEISVEVAERRDIPLIVDLRARMEASAKVEIRANVEGRLTEMLFKEGSLIEQGKLLFRIDPRRYDAAVQSAEAVVEKAEADLEMAHEQQHLVNAQAALRQAEANLLKANHDVERIKPLATRRAVPARDLDAAIAAQSSAVAAVEDARATLRTTAVSDRMNLRQAQANLNAAKAALDTAHLDRTQTEIHAPIGGLISAAEVSAGNYVGRMESSRLAVISKVNPIRVVFGISEALYLRTVNTVEKAGLEDIELILVNGAVYPFKGRFTNLEGGIDEKTGSFLAVAQFRNSKAFLLPGMTGHVRFTAGNRTGAVLVSEKALFETQGVKAVRIIGPDHKVEVRRVEIDGSYQGKSIITGGLAGGEAVIVHGGSTLRPGDTAPPYASSPPRSHPAE